MNFDGFKNYPDTTTPLNADSMIMKIIAIWDSHGKEQQ